MKNIGQKIHNEVCTVTVHTDRVVSGYIYFMRKLPHALFWVPGQRNILVGQIFFWNINIFISLELAKSSLKIKEYKCTVNLLVHY